MELWLQNFVSGIFSNPISFISDVVGLGGGIFGGISGIETRKLRNRILNNDRIQQYNANRIQIASEAGAIQKALSDGLTGNPIMNDLNKLIGKLEFYQDIISDKKFKKYIRKIKVGENIISNLEKIKLICLEREIII